ncbi:phospholipase, patatin family protein [Bacillus methanolicus PB1]|uniref:Phospholipase, patatin family protein n=1 Tax=Bacillus methanolicus PB1 TaxID=997296 RepID=I3DX63_BACMT|nr:patatin-like phospholipase family protein [Bacillus methanolicus]EIJ78834.1 phospholipase, patatin family protein [Bacillus methanolicus PB1]
MFIDGVFSGGGIKGFALIGAIEEVEKRGFRFKRVAGTSAGSIVAALVIAGYTSEEIYHLLDELDLQTFMDPRTSFIPFPIAKWLFFYWSLGLYKGNALEKWLQEKLAAKGLRTFADLPPKSLRVIASDLSNGRLLVLPDDLEKYGIIQESFPIAKAIRMSCSLPFFFEPVKLRTHSETNIIVDGGVLSNFPMWLFDKEHVQKVRPVLGIKLSRNTYERPKNKISNAFHLFEALFETMKDAHDARYISRKHEKNIIFIPTERFMATEFTLTEEDKQALLSLGRKSAEQFLKKWSY